MNQYKHNTIYHRLVGLIVFIVVISAVVPYLVFSRSTRRALADDVKTQVFQYIKSTATYLEAHDLPLTDVEKLFNSDYMQLKIFDDTTKFNLTAAEQQELDASQSAIFTKLRTNNESKSLYVAVVKHHQQYIAAQVDLRPIFQLSHQINLLSLLLTLLLGLIVSAIAGHQIIRPIRVLGAATEKVARGDFSVQIPNRTPNDEIGSLINSFNIMTRELGSVEMLRSDFISDISHEFKTPLTAIEGFAKLLEEEPDAAARREYVQVITEETHRLSTLAQNILTLNKIEQGSLAAHKSPVCIDEQIRRTLTLYEPKWSAKQLDLELELDEVILPGYEQLLTQVWANLIDNAVKFSPIGGKITLILLQQGDTILFTIQDEGPGIPTADQSHIFDKFYQSDHSRGGDGNGLGLSIVQRVTEMHHGKIMVNSTPGHGSTFQLIFHSSTNEGDT